MGRNNYFKITYMMSGKYKARYEAVILAWEDGNIRIRDIDQKEHSIKEKYIVSIKPLIPIKNASKTSTEEQEFENDQQQIDF